MIGRIALGAAVLAAASTSVSAQQTQIYAYDVHGRLTGVTRTTGSTSQTTTYVLDKADNRTSRATGAATTAAASLAPKEEDASSVTVETPEPVEPDAAPEASADDTPATSADGLTVSSAGDAS